MTLTLTFDLSRSKIAQVENWVKSLNNVVASIFVKSEDTRFEFCRYMDVHNIDVYVAIDPDRIRIGESGSVYKKNLKVAINHVIVIRFESKVKACV